MNKNKPRLLWRVVWELWRRTSKEWGEWQLVLLSVWPPDKIRVTGVHETQQVPPSHPITLLTAPIWLLTRLSPTNISTLLWTQTSGTWVHTNNISIKIMYFFLQPLSCRHFYLCPPDISIYQLHTVCLSFTCDCSPSTRCRKPVGSVRNWPLESCGFLQLQT